MHEFSGLGEALSQGAGQVIPASLDISGFLLGEYLAQDSGRDHALMRLWHPLQQVARKVHPKALPAAALEHATDGLGQAQVGITDHKLDPSEATLLEGANEGLPQTLAFAVTHL